MTPQEIIENNKKIAEFMGFSHLSKKDVACEPLLNSTYLSLKYYIKPENLCFHNSWDWLMPVIQEIENKTGWILVMASGYAYFTDGNGSDHEIGEMNGWQSIGNIYDCVIEFIDWYNSKNTPTP